MAHTGILTRAGRCAICKIEFPIGELVYFDPTKRQGSHLAHVKCWDDLLTSRGSSGIVSPKVQRQRLSTEPLDPPF